MVWPGGRKHWRGIVDSVFEQKPQKCASSKEPMQDTTYASDVAGELFSLFDEKVEKNPFIYIMS